MKQGFTLIELLVVITILGILAGLTLASYGGTQERARDSRRKSDLDNIKKALELAKQDSTGAYYYPACNPTAVSCTLTDTSTSPALTSGTTPYINKVPLDPKTATGYTYIPTPASCSTNACTSYTLVACLENTRDPQKDQTENDTVCPGNSLVSYTVNPG